MNIHIPLRIHPVNAGATSAHDARAWPPPDDFPIVLDWAGQVLSRFADPIWDLTPWLGSPASLNFGDGEPNNRSEPLSQANAWALRMLVGWWLWGPNPVRAASTLIGRFVLIRPLFLLCSREGINATELYRYPKVVEKVAASLAPSRAMEALTALHDLWEQREAIGFTLLDGYSLAQVHAGLARHEKAQTPYIPPRIWLYQVNRLRTFLDDFIAHREKIEQCYHYCLATYASNAGGLENAVLHGLAVSRQPFAPSNQRLSGKHTGAIFPGTFASVAERFGVRELLMRWTAPKTELDIQQLASYFSCAGYVGIAYLLNFSLMRIGEAWNLRSSCFSKESDPLGDVYLLKGRVTKTGQREEAWITSPSSAVAVEVMRSVAAMRMVAGAVHPTVVADSAYIADPHLVARAYEPWRGNCIDLSLPLSVRTTNLSYRTVFVRWPQLLDQEQLRVTAVDLDAARLLTPSLDPEHVSLGEPWPLAWHQLRRTGAVNMNASGVVSEPSVQYQLKHSTRAMSRYYGLGYRHASFRLNEEGRSEYVRAMYDVVATQFAQLRSKRYVSPYGDEHKSRLINLVLEPDHRKLVKASQIGAISYKETLLGGCMNPKPCDKGGVDSVAACGRYDGGSPCEHLLYDRAKTPIYEDLKQRLSLRLAEAEPSSPLHRSLQLQILVLESALHAISN